MACTDCREKVAARAGVPVDPCDCCVRLDLAARAYLGTPFLHQGRNPAIGIDCVGLGQLACRDCGVETPDWTDYWRDPARGVLEKRLRQVFGDPVRHLSPGCIVSIDFAGQTRHVAIVGQLADGRLSLIHTASNVRCGKESGRVVEHSLDDRWRKRITGIYRVEKTS